MKVLGIIPARYGSTRLEGKPLVDICGKPMIQRVYERASAALSQVVVATDDERVMTCVEEFGGQVVMTTKDHNSGTNRCLEAFLLVKQEQQQQFDVVVNVQGDEPMLNPGQLNELVACFNQDTATEISTLVTPVQRLDDLFNKGEVFVTFDQHNNALYFSRSVIPHVHGTDKSKWLDHATFYKHLGLYAFRPEALRNFAEMDQGAYEQLESLEQLRWLQAGRKMKVAISHHDSIPVDTVDDLERVRRLIAELEG